ncbi:HEPN domain-containing protein [Paracoccus sp. MKU1]|uniref:HEPN domain-containing protein n=1 Tax=Paracoccus sp. MKU1 TaxID=1745182 RepID=UPI00128F226B|nr:HEPN domain-containing protein [Paracoccus sp. MKU1]
MPRVDLDENFRKIDALIAEINALVPADGRYEGVQLRADLAGLLVVAMAATYETCVKEVMCAHASVRHDAFGQFAQRNYVKLNSRINIHDLKKYCGLFSPIMERSFKDELTSKRKKISDRTGKNIETAYEHILAWRHDFAHAWNRNTTIEEAARTHRLAKRVLYAFDRVFSAMDV